VRVSVREERLDRVLAGTAARFANSPGRELAQFSVGLELRFVEELIVRRLVGELLGPPLVGGKIQRLVSS